MTIKQIIKKASALGLNHRISPIAGAPYWQMDGMTDILMGAEDFAEAARYFADTDNIDKEISEKLIDLAEKFEAITNLI